MSLPFNAYDQLRYRGNEYVTDQTLNRGVYRLFQNDVYLDEKMSEHINDDSVHYFYDGDSGEDYLSSDKLVLLCAQTDQNGRYVSMGDVAGDSSSQEYIQKSWQRTIDGQPKNLGGYSLVFRFQLSQNATSNPGTETEVTVMDMLDFSGFYGGNLIIESPSVNAGGLQYQNSTSCRRQNLILTGNRNANAIINVSNCHANVIVRNSRFRLLGLTPTPCGLRDADDDFTNKEADLQNGTVYVNDKPANDGDGDMECKRWSQTHGKWFDLNMLAAIRITDSPDVTIRHCYIEY